MGTLAGQDANDVEFVLAAPRSAQDSESLGIGATLSNCSAFGEHTMWLLDFDCCARLGLPMTAEDISKAVRSFWRNDPYYPRPGDSSGRYFGPDISTRAGGSYRTRVRMSAFGNCQSC